MNSVPYAFKLVMVEIDPYNVVNTSLWFIMHSFLVEKDSQVIGNKRRKNNKKKQKECNVAGCDTDSNQDTDRGRYVLVSKEHARAESYCRDKNRKAFHLVQTVKLRTIRTARHLKVENECEEEHNKDMLQINTQRVRKNDDHCQNSLFEHDNRLPEHKALLVGTIQEAAGLVDPSTLVVLIDLFHDDGGSDQRKPKGENDEKRPTQHEG